MLYRSTRNNLDSFTAHRALRVDCAIGSGFILPLRVPMLDELQIENMKHADYTQNIADVLNPFFASKLTSWDIESAIGKKALQIVDCNQNVMIAQCWHNPIGDIDYIIKSVFDLLCSDKTAKPTLWAQLAIRISLIAATSLRLFEKENTKVDIAVNSGDFMQALAAYYCRLMGLPIRKIHIACNENSAIWDFIYRGTLNCGASLQKTPYPLLDIVIPHLFEAYLYLAYGLHEVKRFAESAKANAVYALPEDARFPSADNIFASVIGQERINTVISSFHSNNGFRISPYAAFSLGAMQDYRAKAGESCLTVIFEENAPEV